MAVACEFFIFFVAWYELAGVAVAKTYVDMEPIRVHIKFTMNQVKRVHQFCAMNL